MRRELERGREDARGARARPPLVFGAAALVALVCLGLGSIAGCGGGRARSAPSSPPPRPIGPLITLAPPGSTLVIIASPTELLAHPPTERVVASLFPAEQLERFAQRSGVDPRALEEIVIADHPDGRVILARGSFDAPFAVREAGERMAPLESSVDEPLVRRVGFLGDRRVDLAALAPAVVSWTEGAPQLAAQVLAAVGRAPASRRHPLGGRLALELRRAAGDAPFALYSLTPLGLPRDTGIGLLLARERALSAWALPGAEGGLEVQVELHGEFPDGAAENFRMLARSVAETDLGAALGLSEALPTLRIVAEPRRVRASATLDPGVLAVGLRMVLRAEMRELLGEDRPEDPGSRPAGQPAGPPVAPLTP